MYYTHTNIYTINPIWVSVYSVFRVCITQETIPLFPWLETLKFIPIFLQRKDSKWRQYLHKRVRERARKQKRKRRKRNQEWQSKWNKEGLRLLLETLCHFLCQQRETSVCVWGKRGLCVCVHACSCLYSSPSVSDDWACVVFSSGFALNSPSTLCRCLSVFQWERDLQ